MNDPIFALTVFGQWFFCLTHNEVCICTLHIAFNKNPYLTKSQIFHNDFMKQSFSTFLLKGSDLRLC